METNEKAKGYTKKIIELLAKKMDLDISKYDINEMIQGMLVELEHGSKSPETDITNDDPMQTFKIVLTHMDELPDYYTRLKKMEKEAESVKTEESKKEEENKESMEESKKNTMENVSKRYKELCGLLENEQKKQLKNPLYQEKNRKTLLKEEMDPNKFDIIKFSNDGLGEKTTEEEIDLYKMQNKDTNLKK
jgi:hypothetical protein